MNKQLQLAAAATAITVAVASLGVPGPAAFGASFPTLARGVSVWMARAMDQCDPATLSVFGSGLPSGGCLQANTVTNSTLTMNFAKVRITQRGRISLYGTGFTLGDVLRVRLTLRVTKAGQIVKHLPGPGTNKSVTFVDQVVDCPQDPDAFTVRPNGAVAQSTDLGACLAPNGALANGNIEILNVELVEATSGATVGQTGMVR